MSGRVQDISDDTVSEDCAQCTEQEKATTVSNLIVVLTTKTRNGKVQTKIGVMFHSIVTIAMTTPML